jgi:hypothetical protein
VFKCNRVQPNPVSCLASGPEFWIRFRNIDLNPVVVHFQV